MLNKLKQYVKKFKDMGFKVEMWQGEDNDNQYFILKLTKEKGIKDDYVT